MSTLIGAVFVLTYIGMALGRVPGLRIDRTGIALMALAILLATGAIDLTFAARAIDGPTLVLLFALMILSAQFQQAGLYDLCAERITRAAGSPARLLAATIAVAGALSALLSNDVVVFALTPLICIGLARRNLDPRPYLIGLVGAANAGSAATAIGNPQNILIAQVGQLDFWRFMAVCLPPAIAALAIVHLVVARVWRDELSVAPAPAPPREAAPVDRWQIAKGLLATVALVAVFALPYPREIGALAVAAALLASRRLSSRQTIAAVDWHLLLLFACLFVVTAAFAETGLAGSALATLEAQGLWPDRIAVLAPLSLVASNTIGNVPAVILLLAVWTDAPAGALYGLALLTTLAGNLLLVGSLANIIMAERAAGQGVRLGFADFARAGVPMTLLTMVVAAVWLGFGGWMRWV